MWRQGPNLQNARYAHACVSILGSNNESEKIIVISGFDQGGKTVEILDVKKSQFTYGPPLPRRLTYPNAVAAKIDSSSGLLYVLGGYDLDKRTYISSIYVTSMNMSPDQKWTLIGNMTKKSESFNAVLLPDVFTSDCDGSRGT